MIQTGRLNLSRLTYDDRAFILTLLNEPAFHKFIGDRGVRDLQGARDYLKNGPIGSYEQNGFGLFLVSQRVDNTRLGICGLVKREEFDHPDLGFAFLQSHWGYGYALEASLSVLDFAVSQMGLTRVIAMTNQENTRSIRLLEKLGFDYEKMVCMPGESREICQYGRLLDSGDQA